MSRIEPQRENYLRTSGDVKSHIWPKPSEPIDELVTFKMVAKYQYDPTDADPHVYRLGAFMARGRVKAEARIKLRGMIVGGEHEHR